VRTVKRVDRASRLIRAAVADVYRAFTEPQAFIAWLPPEGMTGTLLAFDPVPGGVYRIALRYDEPDADTVGKTSEDEDVAEGRFVELIPNRRIVQTGSFESDDPAFAGTMTIAWGFEAVEGGTRVSVAASDVPQGIGQRDHEDGLKSSLANLAAFVEHG
jgi:uncharacterized protein YndB with AHSA1/START domain